jgi:hypothetical protein
MIEAMDDFSELFTTLVRSFLSSSSIISPQFNQLYDKQHKWFAKLRTSLAEAKYEFYLLGRKEEFLFMHNVVERMEGLGQHIGGLKSAAKEQSRLLDEGGDVTYYDNGTNLSCQQLCNIFINHLGPHMVFARFSVVT